MPPHAAHPPRDCRQPRHLPAGRTTLRRLEMLRDLDPKTRRILSRMWTEIKVR
jgi:hypothetical protein